MNLNATDSLLGRTPLHFAAQFNRATLTKLLVQKGATVDAVDNLGETATQIAERLKWKKVYAVFFSSNIAVARALFAWSARFPGLSRLCVSVSRRALCA